ncbi:MAG: hypothetical protein VZQ98_07355 [Bacteroidales bacterium]|nr:hypothetical protein [Bacteroidales bacterium]
MNNGILVSKEIMQDEPCLRYIFHPLHIDSKGKIKREALLPPAHKSRNDVSLMRQNYMSIDKCIAHGKNTNMGSQQSFIAIASITLGDVLENNQWAATSSATTPPNGTSAMIYYAPMSNGEYVNIEEDVYSEDPKIEFPAHADMRYDSNLEGSVQTRMRQYASQLVKKMKMVWSSHES